MITHKMTLPSLVLASASPRRLDLLKQIGIVPADVVPADINEAPLKNEKPRSLALRLACEKALSVSVDHKESFVLAADTVVAVGARILDKAEGEQQVRQYLALLSGRRHVVYGGISLIAPDGKMISRVVETVVQFKRLMENEIDQYVESGEWQGKAGGYGIQGYAASYIKYIGGSYSNVVGLSLYDTMNMLQGIGYKT